MVKKRLPMKGDPAPVKIHWICDGCKEPIINDKWVIMSSGDMIHYGGTHELSCFKLLNPHWREAPKRK